MDKIEYYDHIMDYAIFWNQKETETEYKIETSPLVVGGVEV